MPEQPPFTIPPDERQPNDVEAATTAADRQAEWIREYWYQQDLRSELARRLIATRNERATDPERARDYDLIAAISRDGEPILVVDDERLVRTVGSVADTIAELARLGWDAEPIAELDDRVVRAFHATKEESEPVRLPFLRRTVGRVLAAISSLRRRGSTLDVRPHFVAPMGIVMKADCDPEPAAARWLHPWDLGTEHAVTVAVIYTGIAAAKRTDGWLAVPVDASNEDILDDIPRDGFLDVGAGHGTFAAGVVQQVAPNASIRVHRALETDGLGSEKQVAIAMVQAAEAAAKSGNPVIVNLSLGMETDDDRPPVAIEVAVELIRERHPDALLVAAAGNFGRDRPCWPAALKHVIAVGGLTRALDPADWSSHGSWVDCSTIGEGVLSPYVTGDELPDDDPGPPDRYPQDAWAVWTGTSFAAPQVVGAVAQIVQREGSITPREAFARLVAGTPTRPGYGNVVEILPPT